jgi:hypothetical protein
MELKIDVYYKHKESGKYHILHGTITDDDITRLAEEKTIDSQPMWMDDKWEFDSANVEQAVF